MQNMTWRTEVAQSMLGSASEAPLMIVLLLVPGFLQLRTA